MPRHWNRSVLKKGVGGMRFKVKLGNKTIRVWEIPEEEQFRILEEKRKNWKYPESRDGFIETWRRKFTHKGIVFELAILRYYDLDTGFRPLGNRISDRHVVVEYPKETEPLVKKLESLGIEEFLWHDTLHSWNDKQTLPEQLKEAYELAINDINNLPKWLNKKEKELKKKLRELKILRKKFLKVR